MSSVEHKILRIKFHGRIIDHLGIQMYQSPTAAIAELISNSWDADAENVLITLPDRLDSGAEIKIRDDGSGMTFDECENRYLNVGYGRRGGDPTQRSSEKGRPLLGRKGIGKFAGFGIAQIIRVETISKETGERTVFELDINKLRGEQYVVEGGDIGVQEYSGPDEELKAQHGTLISLKNLTMLRRPSPVVFRKSMARRFTLHQRVADFHVFIGDNELPRSEESSTIQFLFPRDYTIEERPDNLIDLGEWGTEEISNERTIKWQIQFYEKPIDDEEMRGVSIFAHGKLAQAPFFFNLSGGLGGQHGQEYLSGRIEADYLDELDVDIIAPERQRINWEHPESSPLLEWGQDRIRTLLRIWKARRGEARVKLLQERIDTPFGARLAILPQYEQSIIKKALTKLASISSIEEDDFIGLGEAILLAWEGGRLRDLIDAVASTDDMSEVELVKILVEAKILTALHMAEAVKAKLLVIAGLHERIKNQELENAVRDYIAKDPWLISPEWETYQKEISVHNLVRAAVSEAKLDEIEDWKGRIDLVLSSGNSLLIVEFMRPGVKVDWDHLNRFEQYVTAMRVQLKANSGNQFQRVTGYLVADKLERSAMVLARIERLRQEEMFALDWETLLRQSAAKWKEFFEVLISRAPEDERLRALYRDLDFGPA